MAHGDTHRKLRMAMIGGGEGSFIGGVHRAAAALSGQIDLVAGAFSRHAAHSTVFGRSIFLPDERLYGGFDELLARESERPFVDRIDFVCVATPNDTHCAASSAALEAGFHVLCDKPMTRTLDEARVLAAKVEETGLQFGLTYGYLGYPMVTQARKMVEAGEFGRIRKVFVEYHQGWLADDEESRGSRQASWRTDPQVAGVSGCIADIGTHAQNLIEFVSCSQIEALSADLRSVVDGRRLDDDGAALIRMSCGATGVLSASQVCAGKNNGLRFAIYGEHGGCEWQQEEPETLVVRRSGSPTQLFSAGIDKDYLFPETRRLSEAPSGHPDGLVSAFSNLYASFAQTIRAEQSGQQVAAQPLAVPGTGAGVRGMAFVESMLDSSRQGGAWTSVPAEQRTVMAAAGN